MKIPVPRVSIAEVERAFRALLDRLMRFEIVGNFEGQPTDGQVPAYDEATRTWRPVTPGASSLPDIITAGSVTNANLTFDSKGRITAASNGSGGGAFAASTVELDFGASSITDKLFTITDAAVSTSSKILATVCWLSTLGRSVDELAVDPITIAIEPKTGSFDVRAAAVRGRVSGKYGLAYTVA